MHKKLKADYKTESFVSNGGITLSLDTFNPFNEFMQQRHDKEMLIASISILSFLFFLIINLAVLIVT